MIQRSGPRFVGVAVQSAAADWATYGLLVASGVPPALAQAVARGVGGVVSFALNRVWSFEQRSLSGVPTQAVRFGVLYVGSYALALGGVAGLVAVGVAPGWAKLAADSACFVLNYVVMRVWVFAPGARSGASTAPEASTASGQSGPAR